MLAPGNPDPTKFRRLKSSNSQRPAQISASGNQYEPSRNF